MERAVHFTWRESFRHEKAKLSIVFVLLGSRVTENFSDGKMLPGKDEADDNLTQFHAHVNSDMKLPAGISAVLSGNI